ncbi:MAG: MBL fold metallo-hydrolase [Clostridiales bacterium]|nr:MBL fold metallo-hydrolase [Clostridiales bacterium]
MITKLVSQKTICNSYLIEEDGYVVIIDPGQEGVVKAEIDKNGWIPEYIFLTHEHVDHIEDLEEVRDRYNVPVVACRVCSERLEDSKENLSVIGDMISYFKTGRISEERTPRFTCRQAEITYEEEYEMTWRGHRFCFIRTPGHSPGSVLITMDNEFLFSGDYMLLGEETTLRLRGGNAEDYEKLTMPILEKIPDGIKICPGHGPSYVKGEEHEPH